jgi:hypothetical protein
MQVNDLHLRKVNEFQWYLGELIGRKIKLDERDTFVYCDQFVGSDVCAS